MERGADLDGDKFVRGEGDARVVAHLLITDIDMNVIRVRRLEGAREGIVHRDTGLALRVELRRLLPDIEELAERVLPRRRALDVDDARRVVDVQPVVAGARGDGGPRRNADKGGQRGGLTVLIEREMRVDVVVQCLGSESLDAIYCEGVRGDLLGLAGGRRMDVAKDQQ